MNKDLVTPFNKYFFLEKELEKKENTTSFYMPDSGINGNYSVYRVFKIPADKSALMELEVGDKVMVMQSMVETTKLFENLYFCPESAVICRV